MTLADGMQNTLSLVQMYMAALSQLVPYWWFLITRNMKMDTVGMSSSRCTQFFLLHLPYTNVRNMTPAEVGV